MFVHFETSMKNACTYRFLLFTFLLYGVPIRFDFTDILYTYILNSLVHRHTYDNYVKVMS